MGEASCDHEALASVFLVPTHLENRVDALLFRRPDEAAGVDDDDFSFGGVGDNVPSRLSAHAEHHFGVYAILRTAEGDEMYILTHEVIDLACLGRGRHRERAVPDREGCYRPLMNGTTVDVVIPALNEEEALPRVLAAIPENVRRVVVADNGSTDATAQVAASAGAQVVFEPERGYGAACLKALRLLREDPPDIVVFLDGDYSDHPEEMPNLVSPIASGEADFVVGSRARGRRDRGALTPQQRAGNWFACFLLKRLYGASFTDLGPFRAIRWQALEQMRMQDRDYGWTLEMQIKAARLGLAYLEVPVSYRCRIGQSKISGTLRGTVGAGTKILYTMGRYAWSR